MAIAAQPTVLDRLKERLVVALGKGQDKRVEHRKSKIGFKEEITETRFRFVGWVVGWKTSFHPLALLQGDLGLPPSAGVSSDLSST